MEGKRYTQYQRSVAVYEVIVEVVLSIGVGVVLWMDSGDCAKPLRVWLEGLLGCFVFHLGTRLIGGLLHTVAEYGLPVVVLGWIAVGSVWLLSLDQCSTFPYGYSLSWALLALYWSLLGLTCLQIVFIAVFSWRRRNLPAEYSSELLGH